MGGVTVRDVDVRSPFLPAWLFLFPPLLSVCVLRLSGKKNSLYNTIPCCSRLFCLCPEKCATKGRNPKQHWRNIKWCAYQMVCRLQKIHSRAILRFDVGYLLGNGTHTKGQHCGSGIIEKDAWLKKKINELRTNFDFVL